MLHGDQYASKYAVIVDGYSYDAYSKVTSDEIYATATEQIYQFIQQLRNGSREEFEEWYELYKDYKPSGKSTKRKKR